VNNQSYSYALPIIENLQSCTHLSQKF